MHRAIKYLLLATSFYIIEGVCRYKIQKNTVISVAESFTLMETPHG